MTYEPQVDDYVIWKRPNGDIDEGWVYFKGDPVDNEKRVKQGWNSVSQYITIEIHVYPKKECTYTSGKPMRHKNIHCLLICNKDNWNELEYVKNRRVEAHYKELDTYWNERLAYLAQSDRLDDAEALYSEYNIDGENLIYEAFDRNEEILFLEYLNDV